PYGTSAYRAVQKGGEASPARYRYTGMERDEESGLSYHTARHYAPWLGSWVSSDPMGVAAGMNTYAYTSGNPVNAVDHRGMAPTGVVVEPTAPGVAPRPQKVFTEHAPRVSQAPAPGISKPPITQDVAVGPGWTYVEPESSVRASTSIRAERSA